MTIVETLRQAQAASTGRDTTTSGACAGFGTGVASPAHPVTVGAVGFGPTWEEQPSLRELYDQACAAIVRAELEIEELRAEVALLREEQVILRGDGLRVAVKATSWARLSQERDQWRECAEKMAKAILALWEGDPCVAWEGDALADYDRLKESSK